MEMAIFFLKFSGQRSTFCPQFLEAIPGLIRQCESVFRIVALSSQELVALCQLAACLNFGPLGTRPSDLLHGLFDVRLGFSYETSESGKSSFVVLEEPEFVPYLLFLLRKLFQDRDGLGEFAPLGKLLLCVIYLTLQP